MDSPSRRHTIHTSSTGPEKVNNTSLALWKCHQRDSGGVRADGNSSPDLPVDQSVLDFRPSLHLRSLVQPGPVLTETPVLTERIVGNEHTGVNDKGTNNKAEEGSQCQDFSPVSVRSLV
uniref:Uncharacterized protein n=1 Tax=Knipowitschia caucasica TaxID=637954 RepID=A0AAV2KAD9_KNICA